MKEKLSHRSQVLTICSFQMIYHSTEELAIRTNGTNRKAPLTNGDIYQWYNW